MSQLILDPVLSGYNLAKVNDNFKRIEAAFNDLLLHKDGSKALTSDLDVNSQKLLNVGGILVQGEDLLELVTSLQETYNNYLEEMDKYKKIINEILEEAISYGAVDKKSIGNSQAVFTTAQFYAKNSNLTLPLKYIVGKNTLRLSLGHTYLLYKGVDYEEVGLLNEESQTIKILRASGIGIGATIEQVVDGDNDLSSIYATAVALKNTLTTSYDPDKIDSFIAAVSDVKELALDTYIVEKLAEFNAVKESLEDYEAEIATVKADIDTKYSTITDMSEEIGRQFSVLNTLYPQLTELIADTDFDLDDLNDAVGDILSTVEELQELTDTIESNAQTASTAATSASTSAGEASNNASIASTSATKAQIWAEGTDTEVESLLGEHSSKGWAEEAKRYATGNIIEALGYTPADTEDLTTEEEEREQADSSLQDAIDALDEVVVKHTEQTLTSTQQAQVRTNIGAVSSAELTAGLATKQGTLTFDSTPTANSGNPVTSNGIKTALDGKLSMSGGVLTGDLGLTTSSNKVFHLIFDGQTSYPNFTNIDIGWDYDSNHGAGIGLRSADHSTMPGCFAIYARDGNDSCSLEGKPNGTLKWGGDNVVTQSYAGKLTLSSSDVISRNNDTSYVRISGGQSADNGAVLVLYGPSANVANAGGFQIGARKVSTDSLRWLLGSPDGTLKWGGQTVQTTSDSRLKTTLGSVSDDVLDAWGNVQWGQFKFLEAVKDKGDSARLHLGVIAQQVGDAFETKGLDACEYGILCHDEWEDEYEDGKLVREAGDLWMVRYTEALAMEAAYQRRRADRLEEGWLHWKKK